MSTGPLLRTARLELWRPQVGDLAGLVELLAAEEMRTFLGEMAADEKGQFERLLRNAGSWSLYGYGTFMLRRAGSPAIVGTCGVFHSWRGFGHGMDDTPEAGWIVRQDCWGQGLAAEAMAAALAWFDAEHGPARVACMIAAGNAASHRVARRLGFVEYDRDEAEDGEALVLYERLPG